MGKAAVVLFQFASVSDWLSAVQVISAWANLSYLIRLSDVWIRDAGRAGLYSSRWHTGLLGPVHRSGLCNQCLVLTEQESSLLNPGMRLASLFPTEQQPLCSAQESRRDKDWKGNVPHLVTYISNILTSDLFLTLKSLAGLPLATMQERRNYNFDVYFVEESSRCAHGGPFSCFFYSVKERGAESW